MCCLFYFLTHFIGILKIFFFFSKVVFLLYLLALDVRCFADSFSNIVGKELLLLVLLSSYMHGMAAADASTLFIVLFHCDSDICGLCL